jgi:hypothetical protein
MNAEPMRVSVLIAPETDPAVYAAILASYVRNMPLLPGRVLPERWEITAITSETRQLNHYYEPRPGEPTTITRITGVVRPVSR